MKTAEDHRHWSPEMEAVARRTMRQASGYAWMYEYMAASASRWEGRLNIASGALGCVVGTAGLVSILSDTSTPPLWARILECVVGYMVSFISVLNSTWRLGDAQMNDILTQVSYATMSRDLMYQLALPRKDRQDAREYVKAKLGEIEQLKVSAPIIDGGARSAYNAKYKNNPIFSPEDQWDATLADARAVYETLRETGRRRDSDDSIGGLSWSSSSYGGERELDERARSPERDYVRERDRAHELARARERERVREQNRARDSGRARSHPRDSTYGHDQAYLENNIGQGVATRTEDHSNEKSEAEPLRLMSTLVDAYSAAHAKPQ
jgi:hypothetical protein